MTTVEYNSIDGVPDYSATEFSTRTFDYALVIPVINENGRLLAQLDAISAEAPTVDVIVADGGSTDGSTSTSELVPRRVRTLLTKLGPGKLSAQLRMAIHYCIGQGYSGIITMDGNGKDGAAGIELIRSALAAGNDFVQGSRFIEGGQAINTPRQRLLAIKCVHAPLTSLGARRRFTDTTNGFRGHSIQLLTDPRVAPLRPEFDTYELLAYLPIRASRLGYRTCEVPVLRAYPHREAVPTKIHGKRAELRLLKILVDAARGRYDPGGSGSTDDTP